MASRSHAKPRSSAGRKRAKPKPATIIASVIGAGARATAASKARLHWPVSVTAITPRIRQ